MDPVRVILLALLQGIAELFPVSSLGHTVIIPGLLGWGDLLRSDTFLPLVVTLHLGTALALLTFFWRDWVNLLRGGVKVLIAGRFSRDVDPQGYGRQLALVVVGTLPAGLIGVLLQKKLESLFGAPVLAAAFLCMNGAVLLAAERLTRRQRYASGQAFAQDAKRAGVTLGATALQGGGRDMPYGQDSHADRSLDEMSFVQAALIGAAQALALLPGISRSGVTMVAGLSIGLSHESAARFSFLLATPIILAAGLLEIPKLFSSGTQTLVLAGAGGVIAGVAAYLSVRFLMRYFETKSLDPFAYYCVVAGLLAFLYFAGKTFHLIP
ncbi:MAG TPA: undecaprenyl-diphosphate phosphatase [Ktedonobacterales bacterium]|nr:undecaprenyl-diphosphate phosphatase [Ktedonobacterales bacterium]